MSSRKKQVLSAMLLLLTAAIWGLSFTAQVDAGKSGLGCFWFNGTRFFIGGCSLLPVVLLVGRRNRQRECADLRTRTAIWPGIVAGGLLFMASSLQQLGINLSQSAGKAGFITGLYMVLVPLFSFLLFRKRVGLQIVVGAILAVVGLYWLGVTPGEPILPGDLLVLAGSFFWAAHILWIDRMIGACEPLRFSMVQFFTCGLLALGCAVLVEEVTPDLLWAARWSILYAGVLSSGVAYTLQILGQRGCDPTVASMILSLESVFGAVGGWLIGERLSARAWVGCALMMAGIFLSQIPSKSKRDRRSEMSS